MIHNLKKLKIEKMAVSGCFFVFKGVIMAGTVSCHTLFDGQQSLPIYIYPEGEVCCPIQPVALFLDWFLFTTCKPFNWIIGACGLDPLSLLNLSLAILDW